MTSKLSRSGSSRAPPPPAVPQAKHFSDSFYGERRQPRGPVPFLNPTRAHFPIHPRRPVPEPPKPIYHVWRSRDNRKGRHAAVIGKEHVEDERIHVPRATNTWRETARGLQRMVVRYPVWDISYDVAISFTLGMRRDVSPRGSYPHLLGAVFTISACRVPGCRCAVAGYADGLLWDDVLICLQVPSYGA